MKIVILDRDGTLNDASDGIVKSPQEWKPLPGALEAVARLNHAGYHVVLATHQAGLGRGLVDMATLNTIHALMHKQLAAVGGRVDAVFLCPHAPDEECQCRPPRPGLFELIGERFGTDLAGVPVISADPDHLAAAQQAGCRPCRILRPGPADGSAADAGVAVPTGVFADLTSVVDALVGQAVRPAPAA